MPFILKFLFISFLTLASHQTSDPIISLRGLRVDIGYLYDMYPGVEFSEVSRIVVSKAAASGINTLFVYAYNSVYGASYVTDYPHTQVEAGFGRLNILSFLSLEAKKYGIKVVACVPVNNFKRLWERKPGWRVKDKNGEDYRPAENMFLLSASHPEFKAWLFGFYKDLIYSNPYIEGVEIVEPFVDYRWQKEADYNPMEMLF